MLLVGTYIVLHQSLKAGSKPGAQWNMTRNDHSELVQVQVVLPIVLCNFIDELVIFVGFSMCNFFIFREIISNVIVERLVFLYFLIIYIHTYTYNIYIYTVPPGSRPNLWFLTFRLLVAHVFFSRIDQRCYIDHGLCARGCGSLISKGDFEELFEDVPWIQMTCDESSAKGVPKEINCWSSQNLPKSIGFVWWS